MSSIFKIVADRSEARGEARGVLRGIHGVIETMLDNDMTPEQVSAALGLSVEDIGKVCRGELLPDSDSGRRLVRLFTPSAALG